MSELDSTPRALPTHVHLVGGPPMWNGATLTPELRGPDDLYAILQVTDGTQLPERAEDEDTNPAAVYGPLPDATHPADLAEWYFRGWWPHSPTDPTPRRHLADYLLRKAGQQETGWMNRHLGLILEVANSTRDDDPEIAVRLHESLHSYLSRQDLMTAVDNAERAVAAARALDRPAVLCDQLLELSSAHRRRGDHSHAIAAAQEALDLEGITPGQQALARYTLAMSLAWSGAHAPALKLYEQLHAHRGDLDEGLRGAVDNGLAWSLAGVGRPQEALPHAQRALDWARESGDERTLAAALDTVGQVQAATGNVADARSAYREALELYRSIGYRARTDQTLEVLHMLHQQG
ncbi:tetratricopeptide repeat protein [Nocardiopsis alba]|uniref:tetratricopeptide repeat protein n=1 Tax=Nocardiopsis alba TaxID=53437 RepID=UPI0033B3ACC3